MTNENENTNKNIDLNKVAEKKYLITDTIAGGFIVDGLTAVEVFSLINLAAVAAGAAPLSIPFIAGTTILYASAASYAYYTRATQLEEGYEIGAYFSSGAVKYGSRQLVKSVIKIGKSLVTAKAVDQNDPNKIAGIKTSTIAVIGKEALAITYETAIGVANNAAYGLCNPKITNYTNPTIKHLCSATYIEGAESFLRSFIEGKEDILAETKEGLGVGFLVDFNANVVFANVIGPIHTMVDSFYQEPVGQTVNLEL